MSNRPDRPIAQLPRVPFVGGFADGRTPEAKTWPPAESVRVACGDAGNPPPTTTKRSPVTGESVEVPLTQLYARRSLMTPNCHTTYFYAPASWTNRQAVEALLEGYGGDEYRRTLEMTVASRAVDHTRLLRDAWLTIKDLMAGVAHCAQVDFARLNEVSMRCERLFAEPKEKQS